MRINHVKSAQKDQGKCGKCGVELPKGTPYVWWKPYFRSPAKAKRCTKQTCYPRPSELDNSKKSTILAAQESFEDNIGNLDTQDDIQEAVQEVASACREVADEYREALDAWEHGNSQLEELADHYESQADELENFTISGTIEDEPDHSDYDEDEEAQAQYDADFEQWETSINEARDEARDAVSSIDFM